MNAHVGYVRHPEREVLNLEREVMAGCGEYHQVEANYNGERLAKFCRDQHMAMVNTYYPRGGPTYWNALGGREVASRLDYILLPATRLQLVKHCFVLRREGRRLQLIPRQRPRDHWPLMIRAELELLYGGVNMVPQDAVSSDFDGILSALRDPAHRLPLLKEVEKWSSENIDAILELAKQGRIEKAWTQMADTLNRISRDKFRRTTSAVHPEIKEATTRRRDALRQRQTCREALAATCLMSSKLDLAWTTWVAVHRLRLASECVRLLVQTAASAQRAQLCCELQEAWKRRDHSLMWRLARKFGGKKNGPKKRFLSIRPSSSDWKGFLCGPRENGGCEGVQAKLPPPEPLGLQNESIAKSPHLERELLRRIMKELSGGNARRAVPSWSIAKREIWLMLLRPRDPDARETITPAATEAELNNRLLQTTSYKEMLAIMREIRERHVANSEEQKTSRRHLPSTSKPCGIGYQTRPPLMKRFKAMISGLLGYIKELGIAPATWQRSSPVPPDEGTTKLGPARFGLVHL